MMAAGDFVVVEDRHNNIDLHYYVEPGFEAHALDIFGVTADLLDFFEELTGIPYPWDKYHQVAVRDFFAGGMENTGAVTYFDAIQRTPRERLDETYEYILAHEMAHHWFGNLVTTQSWAEIFINEGPATYGSYLWKEHAYGENKASHHLQKAWETYLNEAQNEQKTIINHYYTHPIENFNRHSYQKSALVLHLLRQKLGDEAFFAGLQYFLKKHADESVGFHQMRIAFEEVSGKDLLLFFSQWLEESGHPVLEVHTIRDNEKNRTGMVVEQTQESPVYQLPLEFHVHAGGEVTRKEKTMHFRNDTLWVIGNTPDLIEFDPRFILPAERVENLSPAALHHRFYHGSSYRSRLYAMQLLTQAENRPSADSMQKLVEDALNDDFFAIRKQAARLFMAENKEDAQRFPFFPDKLTSLAANDPHPAVRATAINLLRQYNNADHLPVFISALEDSSYRVVANAMEAVYRLDETKGLEAAESFMESYNDDVLLQAGEIFSRTGDPSYNDFYPEAIKRLSVFAKIRMYHIYMHYLTRVESPHVLAESVNYWNNMLNQATAFRKDREVSIASNALREVHHHARNLKDEKETARKGLREGSREFERLTGEIYQLNQLLEELSKIGRN